MQLQFVYCFEYEEMHTIVSCLCITTLLVIYIVKLVTVPAIYGKQAFIGKLYVIFIIEYFRSSFRNICPRIDWVFIYYYVSINKHIFTYMIIYCWSFNKAGHFNITLCRFMLTSIPTYLTIRSRRYGYLMVFWFLNPHIPYYFTL